MSLSFKMSYFSALKKQKRENNVAIVKMCWNFLRNYMLTRWKGSELKDNQFKWFFVVFELFDRVNRREMHKTTLQFELQICYAQNFELNWKSGKIKS